MFVTEMVFAQHTKPVSAPGVTWERFVKLQFATVLPVMQLVFAREAMVFAPKRIPAFANPITLATSAKPHHVLVFGPIPLLPRLVLQRDSVLATTNAIATLGTLVYHATKRLVSARHTAVHLFAAEEAHVWQLILAIALARVFLVPIVNLMAALVSCLHPCQCVEEEVIACLQTSANVLLHGLALNATFPFATRATPVTH